MQFRKTVQMPNFHKRFVIAFHNISHEIATAFTSVRKVTASNNLPLRRGSTRCLESFDLISTKTSAVCTALCPENPAQERRCSEEATSSRPPLRRRQTMEARVSARPSSLQYHQTTEALERPLS